MKNKNHNLSFITRPKKNGDLSIYVKYQFGSANQKLIKADLVIPAKAWDNKKKEVKSRDEYKNYRIQFRKLATKRQELLDKLNTNEIEVNDAVNQLPLWYINDAEKTLEYYFTNEFLKGKPKGYGSDRYYTIFRQIEQAIIKANRQDLIPIKLYHFTTQKSLIVNSLLENQKKNTAIGYLEKVNTVLKEYDPAKYPDKYLTKNMDKDPVVRKRGVTNQELYQSISKITSYKRLEAFLFWMYSFCLRGLDGQDVTLVEDSMIVNDGVTLNDYLFQTEHYDEQIHIELSRKKTRAREFTILINAYPTLSIHQLLKQVIAINRPDEVNNEDELKLFKWDRITNKRKWDLYADFLQGRLTEMIGKSFKSTRHSFTASAERLRVPIDDQRTLIGNKSKSGSIAHYSPIDEVRHDIQHLAVLDQYQIIKIYVKLLQHIKKQPEFDIDPVRHIDQMLFGDKFTKHLNDTWSKVLDKMIEPDELMDYDLDANVFRGTL